MALLELFGNYIAYTQYQMILGETSLQSRVEERGFSFIRNHFSEMITLEDVALAASTSKRNLSRVFQAKTGMTVVEVIHEMRIDKACRMLKRGNVTCTQVAFECGFGSVQQFNRVFKKHKHCAPRQWQVNHKKNLPQE